MSKIIKDPVVRFSVGFFKVFTLRTKKLFQKFFPEKVPVPVWTRKGEMKIWERGVNHMCNFFKEKFFSETVNSLMNKSE